MTPSGKKAWLTLMPVFVYMESVLSVMTYPGMTLKGFILFRDESFREIRELANVAGSVRTLDSVLLEVTKNADKILRTHQVVLAFGSVDKAKGSDDFSDLPSGEDTSGENSTDSSGFTSHQTKTLQEKVVKLEKEVSRLEKEDFKKNSRINKLLEENSDLQKRLAKYEEDGGSGKRSRDSAEEPPARRERSHSRERSRGRWGKNDWKKSSHVTYGSGAKR